MLFSVEKSKYSLRKNKKLICKILRDVTKIQSLLTFKKYYAIQSAIYFIALLDTHFLASTYSDM